MNVIKDWTSEIHKAVSRYAGEIAEMPHDELEIIINHVTDPDKNGFLIDRMWNHIYTSPSGFGNAPVCSCINYRKAVNNVNYVDLAYASHFLQDCGCPFHVSFKGQKHHIKYEHMVNEVIYDFIDEIKAHGGVAPMFIENVAESSVDLAHEVLLLAPLLTQALDEENYMVVQRLTEEALKKTISYTVGLYLKFFDDIVQGVKYIVPAGASLNLPIMAVGLPFILIWI